MKHLIGFIQQFMNQANERLFFRQKEAGAGGHAIGINGWLKLGYFPYVQQREVLEGGQVTCAEQASADWLTEACLFWER